MDTTCRQFMSLKEECKKLLKLSKDRSSKYKQLKWNYNSITCKSITEYYLSVLLKFKKIN